MYKIKDGFIVRKIGNQFMAVPVGSRTSEIHGIIALSESGVLLWSQLENGADENTLADILVENYDVERSVAEKDVKVFLDGLQKQGVLQ